MKRIYAIILILVLSLGLISCTDKKVSSNNIKEDNEVSSESDNESNSANEKNTDKLNENKNDVKEASSNSDTAKNSTSNNSSSSNNNTVSNGNNSTSTKKDSQDITKEVSNDKNEESFYGNWVIKEVAAYGKVHAGRDTSLVINTNINLSKNLAIFDKESFKNPKYIIKNEKKEDLAWSYHMDFSSLGINKDSITTITVKSEDSSFQDKLIVKDDNTLISCDEGIFYYVERVTSADKNK
ncbi:hypothetical protein FDC58_07905 [Clostridium botulinum]|uniref:hypothetical protein n=1 Tax=unclassified Clostridium TaxID=2614128 RepID=UPI000503747E|nr:MULTISPECIES: hypothetical protein [unclassified Clostridium]KFX54711.1 hypothetical protein KU40_13625 [Clostridium botulinum]KFX60176.1 hypothetical protein KU41_01465 [Clostridium botulinum]MBY6780421.1 hypothetical protein [Clostridium botulinum]MBY6804999.1 hypothetical protein [Clostridium botulinum]MBY6815105.1 hypothetical protein [Clostridium botulinum]